MSNWSKKDVSIILPCHNESGSIANVVSGYKNMGFSNIIVMDDASTDDSFKLAKAAGAYVIHSGAPNGFLLTTLRGIYNIKTKYALIIDADAFPDALDLEEFLDFAIIGNYGLLFSRGRVKYQPDVTSYLKKRFGIFLDSPNFEVTFMSKQLIDATKQGTSMSEQYLYPSLIARAIETKQKVGSYNLWLPKRNYEKTILNALRFRNFRGVQDYKDFFESAFPNLRKQNFSDSSKLALLSGIIGVAGTLAVQLLYKWLTSKQ
jgi:glycosyltransferase involved in cell wall biosynthesis